MKKKGLIISTVVMVVVLIAALTTGTFAWFTQTGETKIDDISLSVEAASDLQIGLAKSNKYDSTKTAGNFTSGNLTWTSGTGWSGEDGSLGYELKTGLSLKMGRGVYTGTADTDPTIDKKPTSGIKVETFTHDLYGADGEGETAGETVSKAIENEQNKDQGDGDFLHLVIGVAPAPGKEIYGITATVTLKTTDGTNPKSTLGMNAAMYYMYRVDGEILGESSTANDGDVTQGLFFADSSKNRNSENEDVTITIKVVPQGKDKLGNDIHQIDLYIFINGYDDDCITSAAGSSCAIEIKFTADKSAAPGA